MKIIIHQTNWECVIDKAHDHVLGMNASICTVKNFLLAIFTDIMYSLPDIIRLSVPKQGPRSVSIARAKLSMNRSKSVKADPCNRRNSLTRPSPSRPRVESDPKEGPPKVRRQSFMRTATESDASSTDKRRLIERKTTAWYTQSLYESVTAPDKKALEDTDKEALEKTTAKVTKKDTSTTDGNSGDTRIMPSPLAQARQAEFLAWEQDVETVQSRQSLLILCWTFVFVFTAIPAAFTLTYASTFSDRTAVEWCWRWMTVYSACGILHWYVHVMMHACSRHSTHNVLV